MPTPENYQTGGYLRNTARRREELIMPSTELAWMMGVLAVSGSINNADHKGKISFYMLHSSLYDVLKSRGERLFGVNAHMSYYESRKSPILSFKTGFYGEAMGNFARDAWVDTISNQHNWVLKNDRYILSFLEGAFNVRGYFFKSPRQKYDSLRISTAYRVAANFLSELMVRVGVEDPSIATKSYTREGIRGIAITSLRDIKHFAEHIHSMDPNLEKKLVFYRDLDLEHNKVMLSQDRIIPIEAVLREWIRITRILNHPPLRFEIKRLYKLGLTEFGDWVYPLKFDDSGSKKNFGRAKKNLDKEMDKNDIKIDDSEVIEAQRKYVQYSRLRDQRKPEVYVHSDEDIIQNWIRLRVQLGRAPTSYEVLQFKEEGKIDCGLNTFIRHFGDRKSFASAQAALEKIVQER